MSDTDEHENNKTFIVLVIILLIIVFAGGFYMGNRYSKANVALNTS
jgi:uncharacterized protein YneF (UPF0154 family)